MKTINTEDLAAAQGGYYGGYGPYAWARAHNPYWGFYNAVRAETRAAYWNNQYWPMLAAAAFANQQQPNTTVIYT
jgi:hypothetical protein